MRHLEQSPDERVYAEEGAAVAINRFSFPRSTREWLPFILVLSIAVNIWCGFAIRDAGTEQRLKQYNLDWFKTHEFSDVKGEVALDHALITAFGPNQCKR